MYRKSILFPVAVKVSIETNPSTEYLIGTGAFSKGNRVWGCIAIMKFEGSGPCHRTRSPIHPLKNAQHFLSNLVHLMCINLSSQSNYNEQEEKYVLHIQLMIHITLYNADHRKVVQKPFID